MLAREKAYPTTGKLFALAPVGAVDKQLTTFDKRWTQVSGIRAKRGERG